jgi:hypothetical protein
MTNVYTCGKVVEIVWRDTTRSARCGQTDPWGGIVQCAECEDRSVTVPPPAYDGETDEEYVDRLNIGAVD